MLHQVVVAGVQEQVQMNDVHCCLLLRTACIYACGLLRLRRLTINVMSIAGQ
jgi:hypothetical protein